MIPSLPSASTKIFFFLRVHWDTPVHCTNSLSWVIKPPYWMLPPFTLLSQQEILWHNVSSFSLPIYGQHHQWQAKDTLGCILLQRQLQLIDVKGSHTHTLMFPWKHEVLFVRHGWMGKARRMWTKTCSVRELCLLFVLLSVGRRKDVPLWSEQSIQTSLSTPGIKVLGSTWGGRLRLYICEYVSVLNNVI